MKLNNLIISLIVSYATGISIPETAPIANLEARYIGELCTAPLVYPPLSFYVRLYVFSSLYQS